MGSTQPGRHRAAKHAAPKKSRRNSKKTGSVLGTAGLGIAALTSASSAPVVTAEIAPVVPEAPVKAAGKKHTITVVARKATLSRARAASRSEVRVSTKDAAATTQAATAGDPTAVLDTTPTLTSTQRFALRAVAPTNDQLDGLVAQTEAEQGAHAKRLIAFRQAKKDAVAAAAAAERARATTAARAAAAGSSDGSAVGTNGFSWTTNVVRLTAADQDVLRATLGKRVAPVRGGYKLSARFGQHGGMWSTGWHTGLDFEARTGSTVVAAADGVIVRAGWAGSYGYRIEIDHGNGFVTTYNHLSRIEKSSGAVSAGEEIAKSGSTGNSSGPHVHFEALKGDAFVDPSQWLWGN
jgi:murein DD-endopeptidase MepM/ murein hydrolase activator NlpD